MRILHRSVSTQLLTLVNLAEVTELRLHTGVAVNSRTQHIPSDLSFSIMSGPDLSALDLDAVHSAQFAEWADGIRALRGEGGMSMKESVEYVHVSVLPLLPSCLVVMGQRREVRYISDHRF